MGILAECNLSAANTDAFRAVVRAALQSKSLLHIRYLTAAGGIVLAELEKVLLQNASLSQDFTWPKLRAKENSDTTNKSVLPSSAEETRQSDDPMVVLIELLLVGKSGRPGGILNDSEGVSEMVEYLLLQCAEHSALAAAQLLLGPAFNASGLVPVTLFDGAGRTAQAVGSNSNDPKIVDLFKIIGA